MLLTHQKDNHLYLVFQDFEDKIDDVYNAIDIFPKTTPKLIKKLLKDNFFENTLERQTYYINSITTYINDVSENNEQYFFHLYILPKDLDISTNANENKDDLVGKIESLSIKLFKIFSNEQSHDNKSIELFKHNKGDSFLQLEANFYIQKLEKLYGYLLNYKSNHKNAIVCSDKILGIEIDNLNMLEDNPLKNYQFVKTPYQQELIRFMYSTIKFLANYRLHIFKSKYKNEYSILIKLVNKIHNQLLKISSHKNIINDKITKESMTQYLSNYKKKKELMQNRQIYKIVESIFYTQLNTNVQFFASIDLTKIFEKVIKKRLYIYAENLFIGNEPHNILSYKKNIADPNLNTINYLVETDTKSEVKQFPDFLIKDSYDDDIEIYHIVDAKYKLKRNILNSNDIRQILVYAILFNKKHSQILENQKVVKKVIIYAHKSEVDLDDIDNLKLNTAAIDINKDPKLSYTDNVFDTVINFIGIKILQQ